MVNPVPLLVAGIVSDLSTAFIESSLLARTDQRLWAELVAWVITAIYYYVQPTDHRRLRHETGVDGVKTRTSSVQRRQHLKPTLTVQLVLPPVSARSLETIDGARGLLYWTLPLVTGLLYLLIETGYISSESTLSIAGAPLRRLQVIGTQQLGKLSTPSSFKKSIFAASALSALVLLPVNSSHSPLGLSMATGPFSLLSAVGSYVILIRMRVSHDTTLISTKPSGFLHTVLEPSGRVGCAASLLGLLVVRRELHISAWVLVTGILRVIRIVVMVQLCAECTAVSATTIATTSAAIQLLSISSTIESAARYLFVSGATLGQAWGCLPKVAAGGRWFFVIPLLLVMYVISIDHRSLQSFGAFAATGKNVGSQYSTIHPIVQIVEQANAAFNAKLAAQSNTAEEAITEYQRRYGRQPPSGFQKRFELAKSKHFHFIDEFDAIQRTITPFWGIAASDLRVCTSNLKGSPKLLEVRIEDGKVLPDTETYRDDATVTLYVEAMSTWINETIWKEVLPSTTFYLNLLDEPRVAVSRDTMDQAMSQAFGSSSRAHSKDIYRLANTVGWIDEARQSSFWKTLASSCALDSPINQRLKVAFSTASRGKAHSGHALPFVSNMTRNKDICDSIDLLSGHGFLSAPGNSQLTHTLVPLLGHSKTSLHNDILFPSLVHTIGRYNGNYKDYEDLAWAEKVPQLYWAGSSTGGWATISNWRQSHRMRLTLMTNPPPHSQSDSQEQRLVRLLKRDLQTSIYQLTTQAWSTISHLFHLRISNIVQCAPDACSEMQSALPPIKSEPESASLGYRYVLDMDGNAFSARFYRLLRTRSCVLKHTAFDEWHDDRLVPWVHFIPVSHSAEELGELMRFLVEDEEGQRIGERIARQGKEWAEKTLRKDDFQTVFVRVLMEWARLFEDQEEEKILEGNQ